MELASHLRQQLAGRFRRDYSRSKKLTQLLRLFRIFRRTGQSQQNSAKNFTRGFASKRRRQNCFRPMSQKQLPQKVSGQLKSLPAPRRCSNKLFHAGSVKEKRP
jgi:hypothetical protein